MGLRKGDSTIGIFVALIFLVFCLIFSTQIVSASSIVLFEWDFENETLNPSKEINPGSNLTVSNDRNYNFSNGNPGQALYSTSWREPDEYIEIIIDTTNYENIFLSFDERATSTGPSKFKIQYSQNGTNFFDLTGSPSNTSNSFGITPMHNFNLSNISEINNNPNTTLRITVPYPWNASSGNGRWYLDNIVINGSLIPPAIKNPSNKVSLEFLNKPQKFFTLNISETNQTAEDTSDFFVASEFFNITSDLDNGEFNVTLTFEYNDSEIENVGSEDLDVYFFNETSNKWEIVPNPVRNETEKTISVIIDHFTLFSVFAEKPRQEETEIQLKSGSSGGYCIMEWTCSEWSECSNGSQTRNCSYPENWCEPRDEKPEESRDCFLYEFSETETRNSNFLSVMTGATIGTLGLKGSMMSTIFIFLLILLIFLIKW